MVRLKEFKDCEQKLMNLNFNSTMVRLKDFEGMLTNSYNINFNSTMVRLKGEVGKLEGVVFDNISIPLWFG